MSNTYTISNVQLSAFNHTGNLSLTGYCLPISTFTFTVSNVFNNGIVYWEFGDGTTATGLTATHSYDIPGIYPVVSFFYDNTGIVYKSTYVPMVSVINFITDALVLSTTPVENCIATQLYSCLIKEQDGLQLLVEPLSSSYANNYEFKAGRININPYPDDIEIFRTNSWQTWNTLSATGYTLQLHCSGGTSNFFDQGLDTNKYGVLYPYSSFYENVNNEFVETLTIPTTDNKLIYCRLNNGNIELCDSTDYGSIFCGTSGRTLLYFKDDLPQTDIVLSINFNNGTFYNIESLRSNLIPYYSAYFNYLNTVAIRLHATVAENLVYGNLSISSNGLDGEGVSLSTFDIDINKFVNLPINFVIKVKDTELFDEKDIPLLSIGNGVNQINVVTVDNTLQPINIGTITDNFTDIPGLSTGGFYKGIFTPLVEATNIMLSASGNINGQYITGISNTFNVYTSSGLYKIAKINEDFDFPQVHKDLRFQEFLTDNTILFDEFFTSIYGNISAANDSLGKVANEKIANFVANKADIDTCNVESLVSLNQMIDSNLTKFDQNNFSYPARFKQLTDLITINHSRLWGTTNKFNLNFDHKFSSDTQKFGLNLGEEIDIFTTTLTAAQGGIVALEKFSGEYRYCNTFIASAFLTEYTVNGPVITFPLSSYSEDWGWGLTTAGLSGGNIHYYYKFYTYIVNIDDTLVNNVINFNDVVNSLSITLSSYSEWIKDGGIIDNMLCYNLYTGVKLLST